jgi:hypothetical protein
MCSESIQTTIADAMEDILRGPCEQIKEVGIDRGWVVFDLVQVVKNLAEL